VIENTHRWKGDADASTHRTGFCQGDGRLPMTLFAARWPGEKGIHVSRYKFAGGAHVSGVPADHLVVIQSSPVAHIQCRVGDDRQDHAAPAWNVTICPAGASCGAKSSHDLDALMLSVPVQSLACALADQARPALHLLTRLDAQDDALTRLARLMAGEAAAGFPEGPLWWDKLTDAFIDRLIAGHLSSPPKRGRGLLDQHALRRLRDFVETNVGQPLTTAALAAAAGQNPEHFARLFARTVGVTPHRYVVQSRVAHAIRSVREHRTSMAEAAVDAGFVDQSHLANWTRRI
jgi:AraC family transcriptional regulator